MSNNQDGPLEVKVSAPAKLVRSENGQVTKRAVLKQIQAYVNSLPNNSQRSEILTDVKDVQIVLSETDGSAVLVNMYTKYTVDFDPFAGI